MLEHGSEIIQIIFADIILSGDNALVIGMAAAGLSPTMRRRAIFLGMALAAGLRIFFAAIASYLLAIPGILFIGGCLLAFVCYRFFVLTFSIFRLKKSPFIGSSSKVKILTAIVAC